MVHPSIIEARLSRLNIKPSRWFRPEIKELQNALMDGEEIVALVPGRYFGGYALLVATHLRLLLIDKKSLFMSLEDIRYDMISEVDFSSRLYDSTVQIFSVNKQHRFTTMKYRHHLKRLTNYVQQRVMEIRQQSVKQELSAPGYTPVTNNSSFRPAQPLNVVTTHTAVKTVKRSPLHVMHLVGAAAMKNIHRHHVVHNHYANMPLIMHGTGFNASRAPSFD